MADLPSYPGTPRWVKVSGIVIGVLVLLAIAIFFTGIGGPHGPGRHGWVDDAGGEAPSSGVAKEPTPSSDGLANN